MCLSPLHIDNKSAYRSPLYQSLAYDVPCCKCEECRLAMRSEWLTRLAFEVDALYKSGGVAVFLTFTYDDLHLPIFTDGDFSVSCFNHSDVTSFFDRLEIAVRRKYGKGAFKKFFVSEYGKDTRRPHYHGLFFLASFVDYVGFCEIARRVWSYGYMFPKFDKYRNCYVDNDGFPVVPTLHSLADGAKYVSKYVTKDMSFYGLPEVAAYLDSPVGYKLKPYLPKHWQSNGIGLSILDHISLQSDSDIKKLLSDGVYSPILDKVVPCPRFIFNKLMYNRVKSDRVSPTSGKLLYDRYLSDFGRQYLYTVFKSRVLKKSVKMSTVFQQCTPTLPLSSIGVSDAADFSQFVPLAIYHELLKYLGRSCIGFNLTMSSGDVSELLSIDGAFPIWLDSKDTELHKANIDYDLPVESPLHLFESYGILDSDFIKYSIQLKKEKYEEIKKKTEEIEAARRRFKCRYPKKLC